MASSFHRQEIDRCSHRPAEAGFTLVGFLVSAGILGIVAMIAMKFYSNQMSARQKIRTMTAVQSLEGGVTAEILSVWNENLNHNTTGCLDIQGTFNNVLLQAGSSYRFTKSLGVPDDAPDYMKQAQARCAQPRQPGNLTSSLDNQFYFCVAFTSDSSSPRDSFLNSRLAFAEVYFEMLDMHTGQPLSCSDYVINRNNTRLNFHGSSALVSYYWYQEGINSQNRFSKSRFLTFYSP